MNIVRKSGMLHTVILAALVMVSSGCQTEQPKKIGKPPVIPRVAWSGEMESGSFRSQTPQSIVLFSHPYKLAEGEQTFANFLVRVQKDHTDKKKWGDIGYHYFAAPTGEVYAGRQVIFKGRMDGWEDTDGRILVAVLGNYEANEVTPELAGGLADLVTWLANDLKIPTEQIYTLSDLKKGGEPAKNLDAFVHGVLIPEVKNRILYKEHPEQFSKKKKPSKEEKLRTETLQKYGE